MLTAPSAVWIEIGRWATIGVPALLILTVYEILRSRKASNSNALIDHFFPWWPEPFKEKLAAGSVKSNRPAIEESDALKAAFPLIPDMPIHDLFFHIRPDLLESAPEKRWEIVARDVMDKFSTGQLTVWGREIDHKLNISSALAKIDPTYWRNRVFIFHFLHEDKGIGRLDGKEIAHTYSWQEPDGLQYADLQVNHFEACKFWPQKFKQVSINLMFPEKVQKTSAPRVPAGNPLDFSLRGMMQRSANNNLEIRKHEASERVRLEAGRAADFVAWDRVNLFTLRQAAHLWGSERPTEGMERLSQHTQIVLKELVQAAIETSLPTKPPYNDNDSESDRKMWAFIAIDDSKLGLNDSTAEISSHSLVTRADLRAFAETKGERPLFLFAEDRC
jgi:hypothetical protein